MITFFKDIFFAFQRKKITQKTERVQLSFFVSNNFVIKAIRFPVILPHHYRNRFAKVIKLNKKTKPLNFFYQLQERKKLRENVVISKNHKREFISYIKEKDKKNCSKNQIKKNCFWCENLLNEHKPLSLCCFSADI